MTWVSPLNYGAAVWNGHGLNAKKGEEEVASWSPAWLAVGRVGELYFGPKAVKGIKSTPKAVVNVATKAGIKPARAAVVAREINKGINENVPKKYIILTKESTKMLNYPKIGKRYSESKDIMSDGWSIGDILHLKIPDGTHSSLGIGNYYRAIGNRKGLKSVIENGVVAPKGQFSREGKVFWNDGYLDRTYSGKGIFALSYDKSGKAHFYPGNKPQETYVYSSNNTPIDFYDEALGLHARIPFTQTYKEIPKTQEGIDYALKLDKINRYVENPIHKLYNWGLKPYLGYKLWEHFTENNEKKIEDNL